MPERCGISYQMKNKGTSGVGALVEFANVQEEQLYVRSRDSRCPYRLYRSSQWKQIK